MTALSKLKNLAMLRADFETWRDLEVFMSKTVNMLALLIGAYYFTRESRVILVIIFLGVAYYDGVTCLRSLKDK